MKQLIPGAEPFFFPGNKTGVLLIHAYTSTPKEMRWMGEHLNRQGFTVCGIRLAGHATQAKDMLRIRWQDWMASMEDGYHLLRSSTDEITLAGLSIGGMLALIFASQFPVAGVIAMSAPYSHPTWQLKFAKLLSRVKPYLPKGGNPGSGWFGEGWKEHIAYPQYPVRSLSELGHLMDRMHIALPQVKVPVLLISSRNDHRLVCESMKKIYARLGSVDKQMMWIEGSGHTITEEPRRETVFQAATEFIARVRTAGL
jgi:carboxylesterase